MELQTNLAADEKAEKLMEIAKADDAAKELGHCLWHQCLCADLRTLIHVAGIICVSWSPFGSCQKTSGKDFVLFCAWCAKRRQNKDRF